MFDKQSIYDYKDPGTYHKAYYIHELMINNLHISLLFLLSNVNVSRLLYE